MKNHLLLYSPFWQYVQMTLTHLPLPPLPLPLVLLTLAILARRSDTIITLLANRLKKGTKMVYPKRIACIAEADQFLQQVYKSMMNFKDVRISGIAVRGDEEVKLHMKAFPFAKVMYNLLRDGYILCVYYTF
jgi:hypothetical protein